MARSVCVVTVHGIGFQQPPTDRLPGYGDALHQLLRSRLHDRLGDDPERPTTGGPVYVSSEWDGSPRAGLARLDPGKALADAGKIAHVALVYSPSEPLAEQPGAVVDALARTALSLHHYTTVVGAVRVLISDAWAAIHEHRPVEPDSTLRPRVDPVVRQHAGVIFSIVHRLAHREQTTSPVESSPADPGPLGVLRALEDDVATYVARNDLRERVRGFVEEALLKLLDRPDVEAIVINAHSQGTVICWDVLARLPFESWSATGDSRAGVVRSFVTAGSPIRKYIDLFTWGEEVGELAALTVPRGAAFSWTNYWDPHDPVADPLNPPAAWRPADESNTAVDHGIGLLVARDSDGNRHHVDVADREVDNLENSSGGGLQAHDYWNNETQVVASLAATLEQLQDAS